MEARGLHHVQFKYVKHSWKADISWGNEQKLERMTEFRDALRDAVIYVLAEFVR